MKKTLTGFLLLFISGLVQAQTWQYTSPNVGYFNYTGSKVGIGTSTPQKLLHIVGNSTSPNGVEAMIEATDDWYSAISFKSNGKVWSWGKRPSFENNAMQLWYLDPAQAGGAWQGPFLSMGTTGKLGVGIANPLYPLHVNGQIQAENTNAPAFTSKSNLGVVIQQGNINGGTTSSYDYLSIFAHNLQFDGTNWIRRNQYSTGWATVMNYYYYDVLYAVDGFGAVPANSVVTPSTYMRVSSNGNVGIGTKNVSDANYKLFVETGIRTRKVTVDQAAWPDYVFQPDYVLPSLPSVAAYVKRHGHLPDMPSADSVAKNGVNLGDNQAQLLKKIEELTLYTISQDKALQEQGRKLETLEQALQNQQKLIEALQKDKTRK